MHTFPIDKQTNKTKKKKKRQKKNTKQTERSRDSQIQHKSNQHISVQSLKFEKRTNEAKATQQIFSQKKKQQQTHTKNPTKKQTMKTVQQRC
jgi:hypothetical protein